MDKLKNAAPDMYDVIMSIMVNLKVIRATTTEENIEKIARKSVQKIEGLLYCLTKFVGAPRGVKLGSRLPKQGGDKGVGQRIPDPPTPRLYGPGLSRICAWSVFSLT